jgi:TetR/AcrR family transcriptional repressor of nem operon
MTSTKHKPAPTERLSETKRKLLDAGASLMRKQGFNATTVDDICAEAGVTKGGFFHYFKSKEDLAKAALVWFRQIKSQILDEAPFRKLADPLDRVFGRLDFVTESTSTQTRLTRGCLIGMFAQELSYTHPDLRDACQDSILLQAGDFEKDLAAAKALHAPKADFDPRQVAMLLVTIIQGSLMLAKISEANTVLVENLKQFRRYLQSLFAQSSTSHTRTATSRN